MRLSMQRGDTLIEVLLAITIFAMVAVASVTIMNRGAAAAQQSLEITLVRQQIDAQAEAIRYIHQAYIAAYQAGTLPAAGTTAAQWVAMTSLATGRGATSASPYGQLNGNRCPAAVPGERPFVLNAKRATIATGTIQMQPPASVPPYAQVLYTGPASDVVDSAYGIWIEAVPATALGNTGYVDFHIRACWETPSSSLPATLGTIVRLYEPR